MQMFYDTSYCIQPLCAPAALYANDYAVILHLP